MKLRSHISGLILTYGIGLLLPSLLNVPPFKVAGAWIKAAEAASDEGQALDRAATALDLAHDELGSVPCMAKKSPLIDVVPELLALADWPLDQTTGGECLIEAQASIADPEPTSPADISVNEGQNLLGSQLAAIDAAELDEVRGGFEVAGGGLQFSFGIERAVYINGELVASTVLNLKDLQLTAGAGAAPLMAVPGSGTALGIIQNGTGNSVSAQISPNLAATIIQNTLSDQKIQNVTTVNAAVNSMQVLRSISVQTAIQDGIVSSLRR